MGEMGGVVRITAITEWSVAEVAVLAPLTSDPGRTQMKGQFRVARAEAAPSTNIMPTLLERLPKEVPEALGRYSPLLG